MPALLLIASALSVAQPTITVKEYPLAEANQRWRITTGPDGALWFTEGPFDNIGRITTSGVITLFPLPTTGSYPYAIAPGPDGALWFTMDLPRIGRITSDGLISEYPLPTAGGPQGANILSEITGGLGTLWLTRWSRGIDRVTTAGTVTEVLFQTSPTSIITGPDGAIWFSDAEGSIGRIGIDGSRTSFPLPFNYPHSITAGPDGALWFTTDQPSTSHAISPRIGRISMSDVITTYDLSNSGVFANRITMGPDGALWFTVFHDSKLGRISTDGAIRIYTLPDGGPNGYNDLALGPDRALWIVGSGQRIVQVIVREADATPPVIIRQITGTLGNNGWYRSNVTVSWTATDPESGVAFSTGCTPTTLTADTAPTTLTCSATNGAGLSRSVPVTIQIDKTPPDIFGMPDAKCSLWPPNRKFVQVGDIRANDGLSGLGLDSLIVRSTSNEGSDPNHPDVLITPDGSGGFIVQLRAERNGNGKGRVYSVTASAADLAGNTATLSATCVVPLNQRP
jgi:virginiamycin B lyase